MLQPTVFVSYSHKDEDWKDRVVTHLRVLQADGFLDLWDDRRIGGGEDWEQAIERAIETASLAVLLISANSLTSEVILRKEVVALMERRRAEGLHIFPILIKPCAWQTIDWLRRLNLRPRDGLPLSSGTEYQIDRALAEITHEIHAIILQNDRTENFWKHENRQLPSAREVHVLSWVLELKGSYKDFDKKRAERLAKQLQAILRDSHLTIRKIEEGSILIYFESSRAAYEQLESLLHTGELNKILGMTVLDLRIDNASETSPMKIKSERQFGTLMHAHDQFYSGVMVKLLEDLGSLREAHFSDVDNSVGSMLDKISTIYGSLPETFDLRKTLLPKLDEFNRLYLEWRRASHLSVDEMVSRRQELIGFMRRVRRHIRELINLNQIVFASELKSDFLNRLYASGNAVLEFSNQLPRTTKFLRKMEKRVLTKMGSLGTGTSRRLDRAHEFRLVVRKFYGKHFEAVNREALDKWSRDKLGQLSETAFLDFRANFIREFQVGFEHRPVRIDRVRELLDRSSSLLEWR